MKWGKLKLPWDEKISTYNCATSFLNSEAFVFHLTPTKLPAMFCVCVCVEMKANLIVAEEDRRTEDRGNSDFFTPQQLILQRGRQQGA